MKNSESANKEIERKFLVDKLPFDISELPHKEIKQGYIVYAEDGTEVRLRKIGDQFFITVKSGADMVRNETEVELSFEQFEQLWHLTRGKRVEKKRYYYNYNNKVIEIDFYEGFLEGLNTAEIEFESEAEAKNFSLPAWFGKELTHDKRYKNIVLAQFGLPTENN